MTLPAAYAWLIDRAGAFRAVGSHLHLSLHKEYWLFQFGVKVLVFAGIGHKNVWHWAFLA